jgi:hypothetical protein
LQQIRTQGWKNHIRELLTPPISLLTLWSLRWKFLPTTTKLILCGASKWKTRKPQSSCPLLTPFVSCGGANGTAEFAAAWFNHAASQGRQVTINNRCGITASDFDTPEYTTFSSVSERKWESNEGMDPYSYGYNRATPAETYMNATTLINSLVDMISKNGNFLLDVGPKADGTIDATEVAHLLEAGTWIKANSEAIFNTTYWYVAFLINDLRLLLTHFAGLLPLRPMISGSPRQMMHSISSHSPSPPKPFSWMCLCRSSLEIISP